MSLTWRVVGAALLLMGCETSGRLIVQARTDLVPARELAAVEVVLRRGDIELERIRTEANADGAWAAGVRVLEVDGLEPDIYRADVRALGTGGQVLVERPVRMDIAGGAQVVTVLLTRDCVGVLCPGPDEDVDATACVGGRCLSERCTEETPDACGPPQCTSDVSCGEGSSCATRTCTPTGTCLELLEDALCGGDEICTSRGCGAVTAFEIVSSTTLASAAIPESPEEEDEIIEDLALGGDGVLYVTGAFFDTLTLGTETEASDGTSGYLAGLDPNLVPRFLTTFGSEGIAAGVALSRRERGGAYFSGTFDSNTQIGAFALASSGARGLVVGHVDRDGVDFARAFVSGMDDGTRSAVATTDTGLIAAFGFFGPGLARQDISQSRHPGPDDLRHESRRLAATPAESLSSRRRASRIPRGDIGRRHGGRG